MGVTYDPRVEEWRGLHKERGGSLSWEQIGEKYGVTGNLVKKQVLKWEKGKAVSSTEEPPSLLVSSTEPTPVDVAGREVKGEIVFEDKKRPPSDGDIQALLDAYLNVIDKAKKMSTKQRFANVRFTGNLPVGLNFFGDSHVGGWGWAAMRQLEDLRLTAETDGLFPTFMGDEWDNFIFNFGKWASVMPPDHQRKIATHMFKQIFPKTMAVVGGNHLHWTKKMVDIDLNAELAEKAQAVFLGHRGDVMAQVGSQAYHLYLHHKARGASTVNKTNSARVISNDIGGADVIVEADKHDPWEQTSYHHRKRQVWLRTGTYKIDDDYTDEAGFMQGKWDMPLVILLPDKHKVIPFMDFRDGLDTLEFLRSKYRRGAMHLGT